MPTRRYPPYKGFFWSQQHIFAHLVQYIHFPDPTSTPTKERKKKTAHTLLSKQKWDSDYRIQPPRPPSRSPHFIHHHPIHPKPQPRTTSHGCHHHHRCSHHKTHKPVTTPLPPTLPSCQHPPVRRIHLRRLCHTELWLSGWPKELLLQIPLTVMMVMTSANFSLFPHNTRNMERNRR